jgi:hypothetical protein
MIEPEVEEENLRLQDVLKKSIFEKRHVNDKEISAFRRDDMNRMSENQILLKEINALRALVRQKPQGKDLPRIDKSASGVPETAVAVKKNATTFPSIKA